MKEGADFPSEKLVIALIGQEHTTMSKERVGTAEIFALEIPIATWSTSADSLGPVCGQYEIPFQIATPVWLPESTLLADESS